MKLALLSTIVVFSVSLSASAQQGFQLKVPEDKRSYSLGADLGNTLRQQSFEVDLEAVVLGLKDVFGGTKLRLSDQELKRTLGTVRNAAARPKAQVQKKKFKANEKTPKLVLLDSDETRLGYAVGAESARRLSLSRVKVRINPLIAGLRHALNGKALLLSESEIRDQVQAFQIQVRQERIHNFRLAFVENQRQGSAFLTENRSKPGVEALASGLQYRILRKGSGRAPSDSDTVRCLIRGKLLDGTVIDSTANGQPRSLKVSDAIPCLKLALKLMPVGSKWTLYSPASLAYGPRGLGSKIGPNATVIYDLELVSIK